MKKILFIITFLATFVFQLSAQRIITTDDLNLRTAPTSNSYSYGLIPAGNEVKLVTYNKGDQWCKVFYGNYIGYVNINYLRVEENYNKNDYKPINPYGTRYTATEEDDAEVVTNPTSSVHYYNNVDNNTIQAPTHYSVQPQGATAVCADGTYSFSQHTKGTCSQHGGVAQWLR